MLWYGDYVFEYKIPKFKISANKDIFPTGLKFFCQMAIVETILAKLLLQVIPPVFHTMKVTLKKAQRIWQFLHHQINSWGYQCQTYCRCFFILIHFHFDVFPLLCNCEASLLR